MKRLFSPLLIFSILAVAGCQSTDGLRTENDVAARGPSSLQIQPAPESSERLVGALWRAAMAETREDAPALLEALDTINALGARPLDEAAAADLARWNTLVPQDKRPMRGRMLGPGFKSGELAPGATVSLEQIFVGGQSAHIALSSQKDRSVQVRITDYNDKEICSQAASEVSCRWLPVFTQRHHINVVNPGEAEVRYYLAIE